MEVDLTGRLDTVRERINSATSSVGRSPEDVTLVAVTKGFSNEVIEEAYNAGLIRFGENRVSEVLDKKRVLPDEIVKEGQWHFIGHLQSNKVRKIPGEIDLIHSVDRMSVIEEIDRRMEREGYTQDVLMQVNVTGEESKHGADPDRAKELLPEIIERDPLRLRGLMTMAPWTEDESVLHDTFSRCRELRDRLSEGFDVDLPELSMGMTNDFEIAIEEGSTMIRLGRALFGERPD